MEGPRRAEFPTAIRYSCSEICCSPERELELEEGTGVYMGLCSDAVGQAITLSVFAGFHLCRP